MEMIDTIPYRCPWCGSERTFLSLTELKSHLNKEHSYIAGSQSRITVFKNRTNKPTGQSSAILHTFMEDGRRLEKQLRKAKEAEMNNKTQRYKSHITEQSSFVPHPGIYVPVTPFHDNHIKNTLDRLSQNLTLSRSGLWRTEDMLYKTDNVLTGVEMSADLHRVEQSQKTDELRAKLQAREAELNKLHQDFDRIKLERTDANAVSEAKKSEETKVLFNEECVGKETQINRKYMQSRNFQNRNLLKEGNDAEYDEETCKFNSRELSDETDFQNQLLAKQEDYDSKMNCKVVQTQSIAMKKLQNKDRQLARAKARLDKLEQDREVLLNLMRDLLSKEHADNKQLQNELRTKDKQLRKLNSDINSVKSNHKELLAETFELYKQAEKGLQKIKQQLTEKDSQLKVANEKLVHFESSNQLLQFECKTKEQQAEEVEAMMKTTLKNIQEQLKSVHTKLQSETSSKLKLSAEKAAIEEQLRQKDTTEDELKNKIIAKEEELIQAKTNLQSLQTFLDAASQKEAVAREELKTFISELIDRVEKAENETKVLKKTLAIRQNSVTRRQDDVTIRPNSVTRGLDNIIIMPDSVTSSQNYVIIRPDSETTKQECIIRPDNVTVGQHSESPMQGYNTTRLDNVIARPDVLVRGQVGATRGEEYVSISPHSITTGQITVTTRPDSEARHFNNETVRPDNVTIRQDYVAISQDDITTRPRGQDGVAIYEDCRQDVRIGNIPATVHQNLMESGLSYTSPRLSPLNPARLNQPPSNNIITNSDKVITESQSAEHYLNNHCSGLQLHGVSNEVRDKNIYPEKLEPQREITQRRSYDSVQTEMNGAHSAPSFIKQDVSGFDTGSAVCHNCKAPITQPKHSSNPNASVPAVCEERCAVHSVARGNCQHVPSESRTTKFQSSQVAAGSSVLPPSSPYHMSSSCQNSRDAETACSVPQTTSCSSCGRPVPEMIAHEPVTETQFRSTVKQPVYQNHQEVPEITINHNNVCDDSQRQCLECVVQSNGRLSPSCQISSEGHKHHVIRNEHNFKNHLHQPGNSLCINHDHHRLPDKIKMSLEKKSYDNNSVSDLSGHPHVNYLPSSQNSKQTHWQPGNVYRDKDSPQSRIQIMSRHRPFTPYTDDHRYYEHLSDKSPDLEEEFSITPELIQPRYSKETLSRLISSRSLPYTPDDLDDDYSDYFPLPRRSQDQRTKPEPKIYPSARMDKHNFFQYGTGNPLVSRSHSRQKISDEMSHFVSPDYQSDSVNRMYRTSPYRDKYYLKPRQLHRKMIPENYDLLEDLRFDSDVLPFRSNVNHPVHESFSGSQYNARIDPLEKHIPAFWNKRQTVKHQANDNIYFGNIDSEDDLSEGVWDDERSGNFSDSLQLSIDDDGIMWGNETDIQCLPDDLYRISPSGSETAGDIGSSLLSGSHSAHNLALQSANKVDSPLPHKVGPNHANDFTSGYRIKRSSSNTGSFPFLDEVTEEEENSYPALPTSASAAATLKRKKEASVRDKLMKFLDEDSKEIAARSGKYQRTNTDEVYRRNNEYRSNPKFTDSQNLNNDMSSKNRQSSVGKQQFKESNGNTKTSSKLNQVYSNDLESSSDLSYSSYMPLKNSSQEKTSFPDNGSSSKPSQRHAEELAEEQTPMEIRKEKGLKSVPAKESSVTMTSNAVNNKYPTDHTDDRLLLNTNGRLLESLDQKPQRLSDKHRIMSFDKAVDTDTEVNTGRTINSTDDSVFQTAQCPDDVSKTNEESNKSKYAYPHHDKEKSDEAFVDKTQILENADIQQSSKGPLVDGNTQPDTKQHSSENISQFPTVTQNPEKSLNETPGSSEDETSIPINKEDSTDFDLESDLEKVTSPLKLQDRHGNAASDRREESTDFDIESDLEKVMSPQRLLSSGTSNIRNKTRRKKEMALKKQQQRKTLSGQLKVPRKSGDESSDTSRSGQEEARRRRVALFSVFKHLDTWTLGQVSRVCREWKKVSRHPSLWKHIHLKSERISSSYLITISQWCTQTQSITLEALQGRKRHEDESDEEYRRKTKGSLEPGMEELLKVCQNSLTSLYIIDCGNLLTDKSLWLASCYSRLLEKLKYVSSSDPVTAEVLWALVGGCPGVTSLFIPPQFPCEKPKVFNNKCLLLIGKFYRDLLQLGIGGKEIDINGILPVVQGCQRLQFLELDHMAELNDDDATALCRAGLSNLSVLELTGTLATPKAIQVIYKSCRHLKKIGIFLSFSDCYDDPKNKNHRKEYSKKILNLQALESKAGLGNILAIQAAPLP